MAATKNVPQVPYSHNSSEANATSGVMPSFAAPRCGVLTLYGYGIRVSVDRGHLQVEDGIGSDRHQFRLPRVGHGLKRLIVIGSDGMISLAALRWLADQDAAFVMLNRDGTVLATTGPVRPSDARLRRAQVLADQSGAALLIAQELISRKLVGQEQVAHEKLRDSATARIIAQFRSEVATAETIASVRQLESQAASAYWSAWRNLPITFPKTDLPRVPDHWRSTIPVQHHKSGILVGQPIGDVELSYCLAERCFSLVRWAPPSGLPPPSEALARACSLRRVLSHAV